MDLSKISNLKVPQLSTLITTKIRSFVQQGQYLEALHLYTNHSPQQAATPFTFPPLLKACATISSPHNHNHGKKLHATIITMGFHSDPYISTSLINMYVKCGSLDQALQVFDKVSQRESFLQDVTLWNAVIDGYFRYARVNEGILRFRLMVSMGVYPDVYTLNIILGTSCSLIRGREVHGYVVRNIFDHSDPFLETALVNMYMKCRRPVYAWRLFSALEDKGNKIAVWNAMMRGFSENGLWEKSFELYAVSKHEKCQLGAATFSNVLTACEDVGLGRMVHCDVIKMGLKWESYVCTSLLSMYGRFMLVEDARRIFHGTVDKGMEVWNAMISVYVGNGMVLKGLDIYYQMKLSGLVSDTFTLTNVLSACSMIGCYVGGIKVHAEMIKRPIMHGNKAVQSALLTMYAKCGHIEDAALVFKSIEDRDEVTWGAMVSGFCQNEKYEECFSLFRAMMSQGVGADSQVMVSVAGACAALEHTELGHAIHGFVHKTGMIFDVFVSSALIDMYASCRLPHMAASLFALMPRKNLVAWNSLTSCYNRNGLFNLSIDLLPQLISDGLTPDFVSITNALVAVSSLTALLRGKTLHGYQIRLNIQSDVQVENALIDMYTKCGCLKYAQRLFDNTSGSNIVTWNSMIAGYGSHGDCTKAIELFSQMGEVHPDEITFLALISACSHSGFIMEGLRLFHLMKLKYNVEPRMEHYVSMVDLWGRAGYLKEAYGFIQTMPMKADRSVFLCLLGACRIYGNVEMGKLLADQLLKMEPSRGSDYVQLLNLYGERESWDKVVDVRVSMKERGLKKNPGCSWIETKDRLNVFLSGDAFSPFSLEIYDTLKSIRRNMEEETSCDDFAL